MALLADQYGNRELLLKFGRRAVSARPEPIATQIKKADAELETEQVKQKKALQHLQDRIVQDRSRSEDSLKFRVDELPPSKEQQRDQRLRKGPGESDDSLKWDKCFVRMYTAAEWAVEQWAKRAGLECIDLNIANRYDPQDYRIAGRNVDVKTTISVGRCELKNHWSPDSLPETDEIICAVRSKSHDRDSSTSQHYIQGIFHSSAYNNISARLKYFTLEKRLLNPCYFHPPQIFFDVKGLPAPQVPPIDTDVINSCAESGECLDAIFHLTRQDSAPLLRKALPPCHQDFVPVAAELMDSNLRHLLPLYLADYLLERILSKKTVNNVDASAARKVLWSICQPYHDQKKYLEHLMHACKILPEVHCAHHPEEGIEDMAIEVIQPQESGKLILRARCPTDLDLTTTFLTYSWKTGETLVYKETNILPCGVPRCGCLTHPYGLRDRIGKRTCPKYGEEAYKNQLKLPRDKPTTQ